MLFRDAEAALFNTLALAWTCGAWLGSFALMAAHAAVLNIAGVLLCTHAMVLAAYLIHEAAHQSLFAAHWANRCAGEMMNFIAGSSYASFERIRHMHIRHHLERADVTCFDFKGLLRRRPRVRRALQILEWGYIPATELLMHGQVICRPLFVASQRRHRPRVAAMLMARAVLLLLLGLYSWKALLLYALAAVLLLHVLNFFDAFHHTFEQYFVAADEALPMGGRDRRYEEANTYSNFVSRRFPWLNLLTLNFGYHNAHHQRASVPWYRLPALHKDLYGDQRPPVLSLAELLRTWHCNRVRRVSADDYGGPAPQVGPRRAEGFVGAHGVSFLTVV
ncbi:MAG: fatty acid desaturase [Steroidobacteraceae bacterium]